MPSATSQVTTDHDEIRRWAEQRGGRPAHVKRTGNPDDPGILRIDFPGYSGEDSLEGISWDEWFDKFDKHGLALLYQETTANGQFLRRRQPSRNGPSSNTMESAFEDSKPYVLTELGKQFVHYTMSEVVQRLGDSGENPSGSAA